MPRRLGPEVGHPRVAAQADGALVPQEGFIFRGSLRENIAFARPDIDDGRIWEVCETLGIDEWVRTTPGEARYRVA